jgi:primosomal protein N' (replication factor Y)
LFLVPEIALTTQLTYRLQRVFGDKVVIYHSKFSDSERVELWRRLLSTSDPLVVIGARSAVFLPFASLGLVIVDEEHESSYKQADPAPRYNGRDAAIMLASLHGAKTLLGSATPTVETYHKALNGKFGLVSLSERFDGVAMPSVEIVDMRSERRRKAVSGYFSHRLLDVSIDALSRKKQAIFFLNRRGYAPMARCKMCAFTPKCNFCDVALTYHKRTNRLQCHYCGAEYLVPQVCPECHEPSMEIVGYGTERLEDEISERFAKHRVLRMDLDTTRNKEGHGKIIDEFSRHKADILVGTQMVTKGLDFGGVEVVGILNADSMLNIPDFRAAERAFNMIEQVAGRAGRRDGVGRVVVQTHNPENPVLALAAAHDYDGFYRREIAEREAFAFPPFTRIINIFVKHRDARTVAECADNLARSLRQIFGSRVLGPQEPSVARVQSLYIRKIMLKVEATASMAKVKELLRERYVALASSPLMRGLTVYYDVDPV